MKGTVGVSSYHVHHSAGEGAKPHGNLPSGHIEEAANLKRS